MEARGQPWVLFLRCHPHFISETKSLNVLQLPNLATNMAQRSCLCLSSTEISGTEISSTDSKVGLGSGAESPWSTAGFLR